MNLSFDFETEKIEFKAIYRNRKTLSIKVEPPGIVTVFVPLGVSEDKIIEMVKTKSKWISKKLDDIEKTSYLMEEKKYIIGESFPYLGKDYILQIINRDKYISPEVKLIGDSIYIYTNNIEKESIRKALLDFYMNQAMEKIEKSVEYYQFYFMSKPSKIIIKDQRKRWGSCNSKHELRFNFRCIMLPIEVLDYIVLHEMCHMVHMNHSKDFWNLLGRILPDYKEKKKLLKETGIICDF